MFRKNKKLDQRKCEICWTEGKAGNVVQYLEDKQCWVCAFCLGIFDGASIDRLMEGDSPKEEQLTWQHPQNPKTKARYVAPVRSCAHNRTPFSFNEHTIYLSGSSDRQTPVQGPDPTVAIYLDVTWLRGKVLSNGGMKKPEGEPHIIYLNWPDYGVVEVQRLMCIARWALEQLEAGHTLEVGCVGGHGRTGTFVAGMMVVTGFHPDDAIKEVRTNYCPNAVESKPQEKLLQELYEQMDKVEATTK